MPDIPDLATAAVAQLDRCPPATVLAALEGVPLGDAERLVLANLIRRRASLADVSVIKHAAILGLAEAIDRIGRRTLPAPQAPAVHKARRKLTRA